MNIGRRLAAIRAPLGVLVVASAVLTGAGTPASGSSLARYVPPLPAALVLPSPAEPGHVADSAGLTAMLPPPAALLDGVADLRARAAPVPLELHIPAIDVSSQVLGVGLTRTNAMDAPIGRAADPVWQQAFWYRGSAVPGEFSTSLIAAHVSDSAGRPGPFARLAELRPGDLVAVRDLRTGTDTTFAVEGSQTYSLAEAAEPAVLTEMYGAGPVAGTPAQLSDDGRSHLTLVTCAGTFRNGTHDHRLVVSAVRVS